MALEALTKDSLTLPKSVILVEVGPRDGLQSEKTFVPTRKKIELIRLLGQTGLKTIEATSFVSEKWIPQLADGADVLREIFSTNTNLNYPVLVPNTLGFNKAVGAGSKQVAVFTTASETFSKKNTNASVSESLKRIEAIMPLAQKAQMPVRGYISCVLGCPYEGDVAFSKTAEIAKTLAELGCYEISLGDTIGIGTPNRVKELIEKVSHFVDSQSIAMHFHDTYGQAITNIYASLQMGINIFDSSIAGLGGCPYAHGATGNVATEDVVYLLNGLEIECGVNLESCLKVSKFIRDSIGFLPRSKLFYAHNGHKL